MDLAYYPGFVLGHLVAARFDINVLGKKSIIRHIDV
jgi:hypothetical protein